MGWSACPEGLVHVAAELANQVRQPVDVGRRGIEAHDARPEGVHSLDHGV